jgi:hypothetical protein
MLVDYYGENDPDNPNRLCRPGVVVYLSDEARSEYRIGVKNGLLVDARGRPFDTSDATGLHPRGNGRAIFVMDAEGAIYASCRASMGAFHHSSLVAGAPAAAAGEFEVERGRLRLVSNASGHYRPTLAQTQQLVAVRAEQGVDVSRVEWDDVTKRRQ